MARYGQPVATGHHNEVSQWVIENGSVLGLAVTPVGAVVSAGVFSLAMCLKSPTVYTEDMKEFPDDTVK